MRGLFGRHGLDELREPRRNRLYPPQRTIEQVIWPDRESFITAVANFTEAMAATTVTGDIPADHPKVAGHKAR